DYQLIQAARANDQPIIELEGPEEQRARSRLAIVAGAAITLSSITVVSNATRLIRFKPSSVHTDPRRIPAAADS
ncbi:hypothetical protein CE195_08085, partial [Sodalis-like symbiont of Philaenus spumarius]